MKRNLIPLLGIAFVVAIAATGVFYGLFIGSSNGASSSPAAASTVVAVVRPVDRGVVLKASDLQLRPFSEPAPAGAFFSVEDAVGQTTVAPLNAFDPVTLKSLAGAGPAAGLAIPKGMRAVSIRVADSAGLLPFIRSGHRVDVQAIAQTENSVRTLLGNVEVLNAHVEASGTGAQTTMLNLLIDAKDVDKVAHADSLGRVRVSLRNPEDSDGAAPPVSRPVMTATSVAPPAPAATARVRFEVRAGAATPDVIKEVLTRTGGSFSTDLRIGALPRDWNAERGLQPVRMLSSRTVDAAHGQDVFVRADGATREAGYDLRLHLTAQSAAQGMVRVRVRPELSIPQRGGTSSRKVSADLELADGQAAVLAGFEKDAATPSLVAKLFRNPQELEGELLVVITPKVLAAR